MLCTVSRTRRARHGCIATRLQPTADLTIGRSHRLHAPMVQGLAVHHVEKGAYWLQNLTKRRNSIKTAEGLQTVPWLCLECMSWARTGASLVLTASEVVSRSKS